MNNLPTKLELIKKTAADYLTNKANYPEDQGEMWYVDYSGWATGKRAHPSSLRSPAVDVVFGGELWGREGNFKEDGWKYVEAVQIRVLHEFVKENLNITEREVDKLLFDHGIRFIHCPNGNQEYKRLSSMRFGKILDHYAVAVEDPEKDRILSKISILIDETGYKLEDFLRVLEAR